MLVTSDLDEAHAWVNDCFSGRFGTAGNLVVIEEFLDGDEISVLRACATATRSSDCVRLGTTSVSPTATGARTPAEWAPSLPCPVSAMTS